MNKNVEIYKSGIDNVSMNFCFVKDYIEESDVDFINNKFNINGFIITSNNFHPDIYLVENLNPIGKFLLMLREEVPDFYRAPFYDDIEILSVEEYPMIFTDFIKVFSEVRGLDEEEVTRSIDIENLKLNNHFFVAYMSDIPVGTLYAISNQDNGFVIDASVKENYRNTGILNAMAKKAKEAVLFKEIFNFYAIPTSDFSLRVMNDMGFRPINVLFLWQKSKMI